MWECRRTAPAKTSRRTQAYVSGQAFRSSLSELICSLFAQRRGESTNKKPARYEIHYHLLNEIKGHKPVMKIRKTTSNSCASLATQRVRVNENHENPPLGAR